MKIILLNVLSASKRTEALFRILLSAFGTVHIRFILTLFKKHKEHSYTSMNRIL